MDNGNIAEVTSLQSAIHLKITRSPQKVMACISQHYMFSLKFGWIGWKLWEQPFENGKIPQGILQSAPNDAKLNSKNQTT